MSEADIEAMIKAIREDRVHGASWLSKAALNVLKAEAEAAQVDDSDELLALLIETSKQLMEARPSMAPITNMVARLMWDTQTAGKLPLPKMRRRVADKAALLSESLELSLGAAAENAALLLKGKNTVITHSYSSTVLETLNRMPEIGVIVSESRPLLEGRRLAEQLAETHERVTLIVDAAMAHFVNTVESVIVGADSVLSDGSVVNKMGTRLLALAARDEEIPFYVVCETMKFDSRSYLGEMPLLEEKDPSEVAEGLNGVRVRNPYFEVTPSRLITSVVTEKGVMKVDEIRSQMEEMNRYVEPLLRGK